MKKRKSKSWAMAYCGMAAALCVALMLLGTIIPIAMFIAPAVASFLIATVCMECGITMAWTAYAAVSLLGLLFVGLKKIKLGRGARNALRVVSVLFLAVLVLSLVPMLFGIELTAPVVIVVYLGMAAPAVIVILGFLYAMGLAEVDPSKKGPFAKYLPDDE